MTPDELADDMSAIWREQKRKRQEKRARNRESSARLLREAGIPFEERNGGAHLIVAGRYDFWPGTGLWRARGDLTNSRGVFKLLKRIRGNNGGNAAVEPRGPRGVPEAPREG